MSDEPVEINCNFARFMPIKISCSQPLPSKVHVAFLDNDKIVISETDQMKDDPARVTSQYVFETVDGA